MGESCRKLGDLALGVVRPWPGQEDMYCAAGSCGAFRGIFLNELTPVLYAKGWFLGTAVIATGIPLAVAGNALTLFSNAVGDASVANTNITQVLTLSETNYQTTERPVADVGNFRFCTVGIAAILEHPFHDNGGTQEFGDYLTQVAEYRETMREHLLHNAVLGMSKGNNRCAFQLGLLAQYAGSTSVNGGDTRSAGRREGPLGFTPLNAVVVEESYIGAERMTLTLALNHAILIRPTSVPVTAEAIAWPVRLEKYGFRIAVPGSSDFYTNLPDEQKPAGVKAQGWGG